MTKKILIITDNLPDQINGVVTTYKNIEACAVLDGYHFIYITPRNFRHFDCPGYNEVKIACAWKMGEKIEEVGADYIHIATEGPVGLSARKYLSKHNIRSIVDKTYSSTRPSISNNVWKNVSHNSDNVGSNVRGDIWVPITNNLKYAKYKK